MFPEWENGDTEAEIYVCKFFRKVEILFINRTFF